MSKLLFLLAVLFFSCDVNSSAFNETEGLGKSKISNDTFESQRLHNKLEKIKKQRSDWYSGGKIELDIKSKPVLEVWHNRVVESFIKLFPPEVTRYVSFGQFKAMLPISTAAIRHWKPIFDDPKISNFGWHGDKFLAVTSMHTLSTYNNAIDGSSGSLYLTDPNIRPVASTEALRQALAQGIIRSAGKGNEFTVHLGNLLGGEDMGYGVLTTVHTSGLDPNNTRIVAALTLSFDEATILAGQFIDLHARLRLARLAKLIHGESEEVGDYISMLFDREDKLFQVSDELSSVLSDLKDDFELLPEAKKQYIQYLYHGKSPFNVIRAKLPDCVA